MPHPDEILDTYRQQAVVIWEQAQSTVDDTLDKIERWGTADDPTLRMVRDALGDAFSEIMDEVKGADD